MEQISFDTLLENADHFEKERHAFQLIEPALKEILEKENLLSQSILFRVGKQTSLYSSVYLFNESSILCRICFRGKQHYLSISSSYEDLIPAETSYKIANSDRNYCRIPLKSVNDIELHKELLCEILTIQLDTFPSEFACCSRYEICSDAGKCIHPDSDRAIRCFYRKNLKKGKIFYGKNKTI